MARRLKVIYELGTHKELDIFSELKLNYVPLEYYKELIPVHHHHIVEMMMPHLVDGYKHTTFSYRMYRLLNGGKTCQNTRFHYDCVFGDYPDVKEENHILYTSAFGTVFESSKAPENSIIQYGRELHRGYVPEIAKPVTRAMIRISQSDVIETKGVDGVKPLSLSKFKHMNPSLCQPRKYFKEVN